MYQVRSYFEDDMYDVQEVETLEEACLIALDMDFDGYGEDDEDEIDWEEVSLLKEVYDPNDDIRMFWTNTEGERSSDLSTDDPRNETIEKYLRY